MSTLECHRLKIMHQLEDRSLTQPEAAAQLGRSTRQIKRYWRAYKKAGPPSLLSTRRGRPSNRRTDPATIEAALELIRAHYWDFGPTFAAEKLANNHGICIDHETLRRAMIYAALWKSKKGKGKTAHPPRERRASFGELAQIDGSHHAWFEDRAPKCTLYVDVDDATSKLLALHFAEEETTEGYFAMSRRHFEQHGLPCAFYSDKYSVFRTNLKEPICEPQTQFARAMQQLGIELICAHSPQAKGRVERVNGILQDRFVKELRLRNISSIAGANLFAPHFIVAYNAQFGKQPRNESDAHRAKPAEALLDRVLSLHHERTISKNLTLQFKNTVYEILLPEQTRRLQHTKAIVRIDRHKALTIERNDEPLPYRIINHHDGATPVKTGKQLAIYGQPQSRRIPNPKKGHRPAENHPWKFPPQGSLQRGHL